MKITLFTFILYSLSLTAVAGINNEIQAKLHPKYLLNPVGECIRSQRDKCIFPSISQLKIAAEEFDEGFKKVVKEALVKAEDFETAAKTLEAFASEEMKGHSAAKLYIAGAKKMQKEYDSFHNEQVEAFLNVREELEDFKSLIRKAENMANQGLDSQIQKLFADFLFDVHDSKFDVRYMMRMLLTNDYSSYFIFQVKREETFGKGNILVLESGFESFLVGRQYVENAPYLKNTISLIEDKELLKHLVSSEKSLTASYKEYPYHTRNSVAKKGTFYDVKNNTLVIAKKRTNLGAFEPHYTYYLPEIGLIPYMRKEFEAFKQ